jgi:hypothetical protein
VRTDKKRKLILDKMVKGALQNDIWNINSIVSAVFAYTDIKDLLEFNIACKKWNSLTNHIIHKNIKLFRNLEVKYNIAGEKLSIDEKIDAEVEECIKNNAKYTHYIKKFDYCENILPGRAIEFIETFAFLTKLHFSDVSISQGQFICMVKPLDKLEELNLSFSLIKNIDSEESITRTFQLPQTFAKLTINYLNLLENTEPFVQIINSHVNLKELEINSCNADSFITPFCKHYPSLQAFSYNNDSLKSSECFLKIFENCPQLLKLKLWIEYSSDELFSSICKNLTKLEKFELNNYKKLLLDDLGPQIKFSHTTNIRKLILCCEKLSSYSLNSILQNCPELEEFTLEIRNNYQIDYFFTLDLKISTKIKKLKIIYPNLTKSSLNSILLNCPYLEDLDITFSKEWKGYSDVMGQRCTKLKNLSLYRFYETVDQDQDNNFEDCINLKFLSNNLQFSNTLTKLTLINFKFEDANSAHFKKFTKLRFIKFPNQFNILGKNLVEININMNLWPNYKLKKSQVLGSSYDIKLFKLKSNF